VVLSGCTRLASDKVYQLLAHGRCFSPGTSASFTTTGRHDIAEILLTVAINTKNQMKSNLSVKLEVRGNGIYVHLHVPFQVRKVSGHVFVY